MSKLLTDALGAAAVPVGSACIMTKQMMTVEEAAYMLIEVAREVGLEQFAHVADELLEDNSHEEIALIGRCLPPKLRKLLPKRTLH